MTRALLFIIAFSLLTTPAPAERDVKAELQQKKEQHKQLVKKSKQIGSEVEDLKSKLIKSSKILANTEETISATDKKLKTLRQKRAAYVEQFYKDQDDLGGLVTAAQRFKRTSTSQMLLQSKPIDAARTSLVMKTMIPALHEQTGLVRAQLAEIEKIEDAISDQMQIKSKEYKKINSQQKELTALLQKRQVLYKQTESERRAQEEEMAKLAKEASNLDDLVLKIKNRFKPNGPAASRKLPDGMTLPVRGTVQVAFGEQKELGDRSKGITFATRPGATVVTPLGGTVKFAGPFQKYKQILIVEHAGGYHSLIAGLGNIDTVVGAFLSAGEPVGTASSDGAPEVYYELRQNGNPVNPQKLLLSQKK